MGTVLVPRARETPLQKPFKRRATKSFRGMFAKMTSGIVEVPTQYSRSWPLKKLMPAQGPPHMGTILVPRARGTPVKTKQKWGAHSVRADNLVLALQLRTIPSFKRADNDEKGLEHDGQEIGEKSRGG